MDRHSFSIYTKIDDDDMNITGDFETRFGTSNYKLGKPLSQKKNKNVIGLVKGNLGKKYVKKFAALRAKTYSYLTDNNN